MSTRKEEADAAFWPEIAATERYRNQKLRDALRQIQLVARSNKAKQDVRTQIIVICNAALKD